MRRRNSAALAFLLGLALLLPAPAQGGAVAPTAIGRICDLIEREATRTGLPVDFLARLVWKESRFDPNAVSPVGAEGIAQFMPGTARLRGLADSFDVELAIPASAAYLAELRLRFGNLGLAAAAYNAGEGRISRWLASGGFLSLETESYVLDITGVPAESFADRGFEAPVVALAEGRPFAESCRALPSIRSATIPMASVHTMPWGVQVAGNFRRNAALGQYQRMKARFAMLLSAHEPVVSRVRSPIGRRGIYAVRIGAETRGAADRICTALRKAGGSCLVMRNR